MSRAAPPALKFFDEVEDDVGAIGERGLRGLGGLVRGVEKRGASDVALTANKRSDKSILIIEGTVRLSDCPRLRKKRWVSLS